MTRTLPLALVALVITVAACSSDTTTTATTEPTKTTAVSTATTRPAETTTTVDATTTTMLTVTTTAPATTTTVDATTSSTAASTPVTATPATGELTPPGDEDWVTVIQALVNTRNDLYATADPSRAGEVCASGAPCYQELVVQLTDMQSKGWHVAEQVPFTVESADFQAAASNNGLDLVVVRTTVRWSSQNGRIVDAAGQTVYDLVPTTTDPSPTGDIRWTLIRVGDAWRFFNIENL